MNDALPSVLETYRCLRPNVEGKRIGGEIFLRCVSPTHDDAHPSLRISAAKDVWRCDPCNAGGRSIALVIHSGNARNDAEALSYLGIPRDSFSPTIAHRPPVTASTEPATYEYRDETGELLYTVLRGPGKTFKQQAANGTWSLESVRRVPYRLPQLRAAIAAGKTVVVVEGEKDVRNLAKHGYTATTNSGGSSYHWPDEWRKLFVGLKRAVVIADCDAPGRKAANERAVFLSKVCDDVRLLDLDPARDDKFDVSDLLASAGGSDSLAQAIANVPRFDATKTTATGAGKADSGRIVQLVSADSITPIETEFIVRPYIPRGEATWLEGVTKTGKTMVALDIIARITTGKPFVNGEPVERGNVAIITCEDDPARTLVPRLIAAGADRERVSFVQAKEGDEERQIAFLADLPAIEERLRAANVSLVFVDGTFGVLGVKDATSYTEAYDAMLPFVAMVRRLNAGALIVRHVRKSAGPALDKGIGSVGFGALARSTLAVAIDRDDEAQRIFAHAGCNVGPIGASYAFTIEATTIEGFSYPVARAAWGDRVEISADEAVAPRSVDESGARSEAEEFLLALLDDPKAASEVQAEAKKRGLNLRTVQRAAKRLGVTFERRGFGEGSLWIPPIRDTDPHSRRDETPVANGANVSRTDQQGVRLSDRGKLCARCKSIDLGYQQDDETYLCRACAEGVA